MKKKIKAYCHPHNKQEWGYIDSGGYHVSDCGSKTKVVMLDKQQQAALQDFVNGREYGVQEIGKILAKDDTRTTTNSPE